MQYRVHIVSKEKMLVLDVYKVDEIIVENEIYYLNNEYGDVLFTTPIINVLYIEKM